MSPMHNLSAWGSILCLVTSAWAFDQFDETSYTAENLVKRDVVIVGGGASGTYAAIGLRDNGTSFILVERNGRLGGQTETYRDPSSGTTVDYGVQAYHNDSISRDFFNRLEVPIAAFTFGPPSTPTYLDFTSGSLLPSFTPSSLGTDYITQLDKYPYLDDGFLLPNPVPQDLLLPWGQYIEKYSLQDSAWATTVGRPAPPGPLLELPAIYVFNSFNLVEVSEGQGRGNAIVSASNDNSAIYVNALAELKADILLNSTVIAGDRSNGVKLVVATPTGNKLIVAKQLVLGIPPVLENMNPFGLDARERSILSKLNGYPYYAGLVSNTGLSDATLYQNVGANTEFNVPNLPYFSFFKPTFVQGQFLYWYSALQPTTQAQLESIATATINKLHRIAGTNVTAVPTFDAFANHLPFHLHVSAQDITDGFYSDMYSLQGYRNTWYIGALFVIGSSQLWKNTANMLPQIIAAAS